MYKECHKVQRGLVRSGFHNSNKGLREARQVVYLVHVLARQVVSARQVMYLVHIGTTGGCVPGASFNTTGGCVPGVGTTGCVPGACSS